MKVNRKSSDLGKKGDEQMKDAFETLSEAEASFELTKWLGAVLRFIFFLGRKPFENLYTKKEGRKNALVGYICQVSIALAIIFILLY